MLDALRKGAGTWIAKVFIALLIFSFAIWGVADFLQGFNQSTAAKVGETEVSLLDFERTYRSDLNRLSQQIGRPLTPDEGSSLGIPQQALGRLVAEAAMNNAAKNLQLGVSDERLASIIQSDPAFRGFDGRYDRGRLQQLLQANGYREDEYVIQRRNIAERGQLAEGVAGGMKAPISYLAVLDAYQRESRNADYLLITAEQIGEIEDPSTDALNAYFEENKADFRAPEYREIKYIALTPETLARAEDVNEDDALAEYERRKDDFFQPERRKVRQMSFPSQDEAEAAAEELKNGKTFDDLMSERNLGNNDVALGLMAKSDFLDEALGDAAFSLAEGETSDAVEGRFSTVILNLEEIRPEATQPFEEVREGIVRDLAQEQAEREILDLLDEIEDARAGGALLDEVGNRFSLTVETPAAFDASGNTTAETEVNLPAADGLVSGTFDSDVAVENDVLQLGDQGFLWYEVTKVTPSRDRTIDEVEDRVIAAWKRDELTKRLDEKAEQLLTRAQNGTPLLALATGEGLEVKTAEGLTRNATSGDFGREATTSLFSGPVGTVASTNGAAANSRLILRVSGTETPSFDASATGVATLGDQLSQQLQDSLLGQFVTEQENQAGVEINQAGIARVIGLDNNSHY